MDELLHYLANQNMEYRQLRTLELMSGQPYGGRPAPDPGDEEMRGATLRETLKQLKGRGQIELKSWVCRRCGYPNPHGLVQCRGYLDAPRRRTREFVPGWF